MKPIIPPLFCAALIMATGLAVLLSCWLVLRAKKISGKMIGSLLLVLSIAGLYLWYLLTYSEQPYGALADWEGFIYFYFRAGALLVIFVAALSNFFGESAKWGLTAGVALLLSLLAILPGVNGLSDGSAARENVYSVVTAEDFPLAATISGFLGYAEFSGLVVFYDASSSPYALTLSVSEPAFSRLQAVSQPHSVGLRVREGGFGFNWIEEVSVLQERDALKTEAGNQKQGNKQNSDTPDPE